MNSKTERIQYLTRKAQRNNISPREVNELANLLGRNPKEFKSDNGLSSLIGVALVFIALAIISDLIRGDND